MKDFAPQPEKDLYPETLHNFIKEEEYNDFLENLFLSLKKERPELLNDTFEEFQLDALRAKKHNPLINNAHIHEEFQLYLERFLGVNRAEPLIKMTQSPKSKRQ